VRADHDVHLARRDVRDDRVLRVQLFDVADFTSAGSVNVQVIPQGTTDRLQPAAPPVPFGNLSGCKYSQPAGKSSTPTKPWEPKADQWATTLSSTSSDCSFNAPYPDYNGQWITVDVPIPKEYTCDVTVPDKCWLMIHFTAPSGAHITDTTTWTARFPGNPVRIVK
jgi:hypothetical protein